MNQTNILYSVATCGSGIKIAQTFLFPLNAGPVRGELNNISAVLGAEHL